MRAIELVNTAEAVSCPIIAQSCSLTRVFVCSVGDLSAGPGFGIAGSGRSEDTCQRRLLGKIHVRWYIAGSFGVLNRGARGRMFEYGV